MNVLLAHPFRGVMGWLEGKLIQNGDRFNIINKAGNKLVDGATAGFLATLRNKGLLKEDNITLPFTDGTTKCCSCFKEGDCEYCGDAFTDCGCGAQCPDD